MYSVVGMTSSAVPRASAPHWSPRLWAILIVLCGALFLDALDVSMVGVALPSIRADLGLTTSSLQWVVSGYVLGYGGLLLLGGRAADLLGRRRVFLTALTVFAVASVFGGLVSSAGLLIAARFIKGVAAAFTAPASLSIITTTFAEGPQRKPGRQHLLGLRRQRLLAGPGAVRPAHRSELAVDLAAARSGRAPHPGSGAAADTARPAAGQPPAPPLRPSRRGHRDRRHAAAGGGGGRSPAVRLDLGGHPRSFAGAAVLLAAFGVIERRSRDPLLPFGIFRSASLTRANLFILALFGSYVSFQFLVTQYLQTASGWTALGTALAFLQASILVAVASPRMGLLLDRFGPALMVTVALGCLVAGYALFLRIGPQPDYPTVILPSVLLIGAAFGLGFSAMNVQATAGVADAQQGLASGILQTSMQIGGALVLAIVTAVVDAHGGNRLAAPQARCWRPTGPLLR